MRLLLSNASRAFVLTGLSLVMAACGDDVNNTPACEDADCTAPPAPVCSGDLLIERAAGGTCNDSGQCEYAAVQTDCSATGGTCVDGQCLGGTDVCGGVTCDEPPADECDGDTAVSYAAAGSCGDSGVCDYEATRTDCTADGGTCEAGACVDAPQTCTESQECDNPPADFCGDDDSVNAYADTGSCDEGVCVYTPTAATCETGSTCDEGECVPAETDPCEGVVCDTPPETTCDDGGDVLTFIDVGICDSETGDCRYAPTRTSCDAGDICVEGECLPDPGPCGGSCNNPPEEPSCDDEGLVVTWAGTCNASTTECDYAPVTSACDEGLTCLSGRCVDPESPCEGVVCDEAPANDCDGNNVQTWTGSCNPATALCEYGVASSVTCEGDLRCDTGECVDRCADTVCTQQPDFCADAATAVRFSAAGTCDIETGTCDDSAVRSDVTCPTGSVCGGEGLCLRSWAAGDIIITEWLRDPQQGGSEPEWFEVLNTTDDTLDLRGLTIKDDGADQFEVTESVVLAPGEYAVFARTEGALAEGGTPDFVYGSGMTLSNSDDEIIILDGELEITAVRYNNTTYPNTKGATNSVDPESATPAAYGEPTNWCSGFSAYDTAPNRGTPGASNESCSDPCRELTCPAREAFCLDGATVAEYAAAGVCTDGACDYGDDATLTPCGATQVCTDGACVSRCEGVVCTQEPDTCLDETTAVRYAAAGTCDELTGECDSTGVRTEVPCGAGNICVDDGICQRDWMPGDLIITEFLASPAQGGSDGEWFEVYNNTGATIDLQGLLVRDDGANNFTITSSLTAAPAGRLVFARTATATGTTAPDYVYGTSFTLANTSDQIVIEGPSGEIARIAYVNGNFGGGAGASASLDPASTDADGYDVPANWCDGFTSYDENGNLGTPGEANESCDNPCRTLDCSIRPPTCLNPTTALRYTGAGVCDAIGGTCDYTGVTTTEICDAGTTCQSGVCVVDGVDIEPGALLITEFAANFSGSIATLEWFEVVNTTDTELTLTGLVISDESGLTPAEDQSFTVESNVTLGAGEFFVFESVAGAAGTVSAGTYEWGGPTVFRLDAVDQIILTFNETEIDRVEYDDFDWPSADDFAAQFVGTTANDNNVPAFWCAATAVYAGSRFGTPGADNTECAPVGPRGPQPTELVITEFLVDPTGDDAVGEWIEIHNATGEPLSLQGVRVTELDDLDQPDLTRGFVIETPLVIDALSYVVLARSSDALGLGQTPDYAWNNAYALSNSTADEIVVYYDDFIIDTVTFGPGRMLGSESAVAASLSSTALSTSLNDDPTNWCGATDTFGTGDLGSPGEENPECDVVLLPTPAPGDLVITEVMANSQAGGSDLGEFVELYYRGTEAATLNGCFLSDGTTNAFPAGITLTPDTWYVIGKSASSTFFGSVVPDIVMPTLGLSNSGDTIIVSCGTSVDETVIDEYTYAGGAVSVGLSLQFALPISSATSTDNDDSANWCLTPADVLLNYADNGGNLVYGTPGGPNRCTVDPVLPGDSSVWINEIHYDNAGGDENEGVEIAGPAGGNVHGWSIVLYNGSGGAVYDTFGVTGTLSSGADIGFAFVPTPGIQNGDPDGIALVDADGEVVLFLSYEGTFAATNGPASGMTAQEIGVAESSTTATSESLQLAGTGCAYGDFTWTGPVTSTPGAANNGQTFVCAP